MLHLLDYQFHKQQDQRHNQHLLLICLFLNQVKINSTSQLINGIFKALQKLLKCFSRATTFAFVNESLSSGVFPKILDLYLKDTELEERGLLGSSL